jgi:rod shape-determining protein MreC
MPIFDINSQISSRFSASRFEGIIEGQGNSEVPLLMRFIPRRARNEINIGDIVISSGIGGIFPADINIGRVSGVNVLEFENTLDAEIVPMIDFSRLEYVFVIEAEEIPEELQTFYEPAVFEEPLINTIFTEEPLPVFPQEITGEIETRLGND